MPAALQPAHQSGPAEDRQAKGALSNEMVAADRLESLGHAIVDHLVIARSDPDLATDLDPDLRAAGDMACGVERDRGPADLARLAIGDALDGDLAQPVAHYGERGMGGQIAAHAVAGMVGVAVGDQRPGDGAPGVDVEATSGAVDAVFGEAEDGFACHPKQSRRRGRIAQENDAGEGLRRGVNR